MALVSDSFNRANGAVGTADVGGAWSTTGSPQVTTNQLTMVNGDTIYINSGYSDIDMSVTWVSKGFISYGWILPRYVDGSNYISVSDSAVGKTVAGAFTSVSAHSATIAAGSVVRVTAVGSTIKVYDDGVLINTATVTNFTTATRQGLGHTTNYGSTWDAYSVSAVSAAGVPSAVLEVDVTNDPRSGVTTWTDISSYWRGPATITRGRQDELGDQLAPATATVTLENSDGRFTPDYTSGPYGSGFRKGIQVRISVTLDGTTYRRFTGYVDSIDGPTWPGAVTQQSFVQLTCSDELAQWSKGRRFKDVLTETILRDDPDAYYPLTDGEKIDESGNDQKRLITESRNGGGSLNGMFNYTNPGLVRNVTQPNVPRDAVSRDVDPETTAQRNWRGGSFRFQQGWQGGHNYLAQDLTVTAASTKWAIECWARLQRDNDGNGGWLVYLKNGTRYLGVGYNSDGTARASVYDGTTVSNATAHRLTNNDWHHVFVHYDRSGDVELWIDGRQRATGTTQNWDNSTTTPTLWVGSGLYAGASTYYGIQKGNVAHVAVYTGTNADDALTNVADHYEAGWNGYKGARTGEMIDRVVGWMKFPGSTSTDNGLSTVGDKFAEGSTALEYVQLLIDSEVGTIFTKGDGTLTFHERSYRYNNTTAALTIDTYHDRSTGFRTDDQYLVNRARYNLPDGGRGVATSKASIDDYGPYDLEVDTLLQEEHAAESLAKFAIYRHKYPTARLVSFPVDLLTTPTTTVADALGVQIDNRITMSSLPSQAYSTSVTGFVEGWQEVIGTPEQNVWSITFNTSPVYTISDALILNDATSGQLNQEKLSY